MARERGQLVFLEGLKSAVDVFFQTQEEPHPLQFLRSVSLQPSPEAHTWQVGPDRVPGCCVIPSYCAGRWNWLQETDTSSGVAALSNAGSYPGAEGGHLSPKL